MKLFLSLIKEDRSKHMKNTSKLKMCRSIYPIVCVYYV
uniref:Uncharacterized protein n=1 Tax=Lepeophtheirus salmonis TaxID=72036 RepID=A0A0K2TQ80_LEPSM